MTEGQIRALFVQPLTVSVPQLAPINLELGAASALEGKSWLADGDLHSALHSAMVLLRKEGDLPGTSDLAIFRGVSVRGESSGTSQFFPLDKRTGWGLAVVPSQK